MAADEGLSCSHVAVSAECPRGDGHPASICVGAWSLGRPWLEQWAWGSARRSRRRRQEPPEGEGARGAPWREEERAP